MPTVDTPTGPAAFPGERFEVASTGSTSDLARTWLREGRPTPFTVRALRQTAGRGRGINSWYSDSGSLTFTTAFDPACFHLDLVREVRVALAAATALVNVLDPILSPRSALIRWPNDVEVEGRKLAGLLPERVETSDGPLILLGVGVNVATDFRAAPAEVRRLATSVAAEAGGNNPSMSPEDLYGPILDAIGRNLKQLGEDDPDLIARWKRLDALRGRTIRVIQGDRVLEGVGEGITDEGGLRIGVGRESIVIHGGIVARE